MATRNLARSAVEGGRRRGLEHYETRAERRAIRDYLKRIQSVDDAMDAGNLPRRRGEPDSGFTDKLNPTERFLASRAGQPWDGVYSELCRRYDRRSLKGWHLLRHVERHMLLGAYGPRVDEHGILRYAQRKRWW